MWKAFLLAIVVYSCWPAWAKKKPDASEQVFADVSTRGRFLEEYDMAAWHATDALAALKPEKGAIQKYVARKTEAGWVVVFGRFNDKNDRFLIVYEATQKNKPDEFEVKRHDPPLDDQEFFFHAATAIVKALQNFGRPNRPYNTYILPTETNDFYVYLLPAQTENGVYPFGGDVRYLFSADGNTILETRQMHKTILELKEEPNSSKTLVAGVHVHVLTNQPEDSDVFHVLTQQPPRPEYVGTPDKHLYSISETGIILRVK